MAIEGKRKQVRELAHSALEADGSIKDMAEQVSSYLYGDMPSGDIFIVAESSSELGIPKAEDLLLVMTQKTMRKIEFEHDLSPRMVASLPQLIRTHVLAMESLTYPNAVVLILDAKDKSGNEVVTAVHLNIGKGLAEVNEIASIYGKEQLAYLVDNAIAAGREVYVNERTGGWVSRTGVPFPERTVSHLQDLLYQNALKLKDSASWHERSIAARQGFFLDTLANDSDASVRRAVELYLYENDLTLEEWKRLNGAVGERPVEKPRIPSVSPPDAKPALGADIGQASRSADVRKAQAPSQDQSQKRSR